jgi:hypothetical protein
MDSNELDKVIEYNDRFYWNCPTCSTSISSGDEIKLDNKIDTHRRVHDFPRKLPWETASSTEILGDLRAAIHASKLQPNDPAYFMKFDEHKSVPVIFKEGCYICEDSEFAQIGMPLCTICCKCKKGHVPADDGSCDECGWTCDPDCYDEHGHIEHPPLILCTCDRPCCEVDIGVGIMTCAGAHCPVHGEEAQKQE